VFEDFLETEEKENLKEFAKYLMNKENLCWREYLSVTGL
jgi:hypothetical protein